MEGGQEMKHLYSFRIAVIDFLYDLTWHVIDRLENARRHAVSAWTAAK
jgi:hypothetical protein